MCLNLVHFLTGQGVSCCKQQFDLALSLSWDLLILTCCEAVSRASQLNPGREITLCSFNFQLLRDLVILTCCEAMCHTSQVDPGRQANSTLLLSQFSTAKGSLFVVKAPETHRSFYTFSPCSSEGLDFLSGFPARPEDSTELSQD